MKEVAIKLVIQLSISEEQRKKALIFIVSLVTGLLINSLFLYLITSPLDMFKEFIFGDEIIAIEEFQKNYGYN